MLLLIKDLFILAADEKEYTQKRKGHNCHFPSTSLLDRRESQSYGNTVPSFVSLSHRRDRDLMAAITTAVIAIAGIILGWITIEMACKPCLEKGREAIDRSLNPDYDPDDEDVVDASSAPRAPLLTNRPPDIPDPSAADPSTALKSV